MGRSKAHRAMWRLPTDAVSMYRRAQGRRLYNDARKEAARTRRSRVRRLLVEYGTARGYQARIAAEVRASPATVSRDLAAIRRREDPTSFEAVLERLMGR